MQRKTNNLDTTMRVKVQLSCYLCMLWHFNTAPKSNTWYGNICREQVDWCALNSEVITAAYFIALFREFLILLITLFSDKDYSAPVLRFVNDDRLGLTSYIPICHQRSAQSLHLHFFFSSFIELIVVKTCQMLIVHNEMTIWSCRRGWCL